MSTPTLSNHPYFHRVTAGIARRREEADPRVKLLRGLIRQQRLDRVGRWIDFFVPDYGAAVILGALLGLALVTLKEWLTRP